MAVNNLAPCLPVDDALRTWLPPWMASFPPPQADDTLGVCDDCGTPIWVGPRTALGLATGRMRVVCYTCCRPYVERSTVIEVVNLAPGRANRPRGGVWT